MRRAKGLKALTAIVALLALLSSFASAELAHKGSLFVHFDGDVTPHTLPRDSLAPIGVRIEGANRNSAAAPAVSGISVALNRGGRLQARGLPVCGRGQIATVLPATALARCARTLVGTGGFTAVNFLPGEPGRPVRGEILLFNSRQHGRPTILAHLYLAKPTPTVHLLSFSIRHRGGTFATLIEAHLPASLVQNAHLTSIYLQVQRSFHVHGRDVAYLSASCATPPGVPAATFPFARTTMTFADGRSLSSTLIRTCRVRH
jgi:hypothetical protein